MERFEWDSLKTGQTIYSVRSGKARTIKKAHPKSSCITLENGTVYCAGDKKNFSTTPMKTCNFCHKVMQSMLRIVHTEALYCCINDKCHSYLLAQIPRESVTVTN